MAVVCMYIQYTYIPIYYLHIGASTNGPWDFKVNFGQGDGAHVIFFHWRLQSTSAGRKRPDLAM